MGWIIFKNISTQALAGVEVAEMPSHKKAGKRYTEFYVKGRDGALHTDDGYSNLELTATLVLIDARPETRNLVDEWADGSGKLILSDDPEKAYKASVWKEVRWSRQLGNKGYFDTATITFDCEPYMVEAVETRRVFTQTGDITNPGSVESWPEIIVEGSGTVSLTVGGQQVSIAGMQTGVPVTLDCENGYISAASGAMTMTGEFPTLPKGKSTVTLGSGITRLTIIPHWRWL